MGVRLRRGGLAVIPELDRIVAAKVEEQSREGFHSKGHKPRGRWLGHI